MNFYFLILGIIFMKLANKKLETQIPNILYMVFFILIQCKLIEHNIFLSYFEKYLTFNKT